MACCPPTNECVTVQNVEITWLRPAQLRKPQNNQSPKLGVRVRENLLISSFHSAWAGEGEWKKKQQIHGPYPPISDSENNTKFDQVFNISNQIYFKIMSISS